MENTIRTKQYLEELEAVKISTKVVISFSHLPYKVVLFTRDYYRKRNNKTCFVDKDYRSTIPDSSKIIKGRYHNVFSTGENDWNPLVSKGMWYKLSKEYQAELIEEYLNTKT